MDQREERQILEMVYLTAKQDYEMIDKILFSWNTFCTDCYGANITLRIHELISYQQSLLRVVKKIRCQLTKTEFMEIQNSSVVSEIPSLMQCRAEGLKYQMHENRHGGIFAWEIAKEMIELEENLLKKIRNQW